MTTPTYPPTLMGLLIALRAGGIRLEVDADGLRVEAPAGVLTEAMRASIRQHRDSLAALPRPFVNAQGELIMPIFAPPQYHWQPIVQTLTELDAPAHVWRAHGRKKPISEGNLGQDAEKSIPKTQKRDYLEPGPTRNSASNSDAA